MRGAVHPISCTWESAAARGGGCDGRGDEEGDPAPRVARRRACVDGSAAALDGATDGGGAARAVTAASDLTPPPGQRRGHPARGAPRVVAPPRPRGGRRRPAPPHPR